MDDQGKNLSGGQIQRLGIARLIYRSADLWIIDEGTGSLDVKTERIILDNLFQVGKNKTIVMITHRLESIDRCNKLIEFKEDGRFIYKEMK